MKRKVIFIILIFFIMIFLFSIYHFLFINKISVKIDDVYYLVNKNEVKVNANKDYRYEFSVSDDSIASFNHASLNGKTAVNYLNIKKKGNTVIKINTYNNGKLIKTIEKNIIACGKLEDDLNLKTIYNIDIGEELTLFDKNDVCLQSVSLSVDNNVAMLIDNNRLWGISQGNNKLSIIRGIEKISSDIIVGRAKEISVTGITLKNNNFSLMVGQNAKIEPIIKPSNASNQALLYESSNNNVATVSNDGEIKAKSVGKCEIIVKTVDGNFEARANIDVYDNKKNDNKNIVLNKTNVSLKVGEKLELQASYEPKSSIITWISDNVNVADVTNNGIVIAKGIGSTIITAKIDEETYATCKIEVKNNNVNVSSVSVTPNNVTLKIGDTITLSKTILPGNATNQSVTWSSSNPSVVTVSSNGVVTALNSGTAVITVTTVDGKKTARANINVLSDNISVTGISITPSSISLEVGKTSSISYIITPSNATNKSVTWSSSNSTVATVSSSGVVTGLSIGTATIFVTTIDGGKQAFATVNVVGNTISNFNRLHSINIGFAGNAILLESNGKYAMVDAGGNGDCSRITNYLRSQGVPRLEFIIASHMHYDHVSCITDVMSNFSTNKVVMKKYNGYDKGSNWGYYNNIVTASGGKLEYFSGTSKTMQLGDFELKLFNGEERLSGVQGLYSENSNSIVVATSIKSGSKTMLTYIAGDIQDSNESIESMVAKTVTSAYSNKTFDVYVASHHGYRSCNKTAAIGAGSGKIQFKNAIVTNTFEWMCGTYCGQDNGCPYDNPSATGIYNIYTNLVRNGGSKNIRFSGASTVVVNYTSNGVSLSGGQVLECTSSTCNSAQNTYSLIKSKSSVCSRIMK